MVAVVPKEVLTLIFCLGNETAVVYVWCRLCILWGEGILVNSAQL